MLLAKSNGETFQEHTKKVISHIDTVIESFGLKADIKAHVKTVTHLSALLHDIGKLTQDNQEILKNDSGECRHSHLSYELIELLASDRALKRNANFQQIKNTIQYAVLYHHEVTKEEIEQIKNRQLKPEVPIEIENELIEQILDIDLSSIIFNDNEDSVNFMCQSVKEDSVNIFAIRSYVLTALIACDRLASSGEDLYSQISREYKTTYTIDNERTQEQNKLVNSLTKNVNVIDADPGAGKTSIALQYVANKQQQAFIVLPKRIFIDGLFESIQADMERLQMQGTVQKLHSGEVVSSSDSSRFDDDINIISFDKLLSNNYNRKEFDVLLKIHSSVVIIDEFHEFCNINRMLFPFQVFVRMRQFKNDSKLVLLSGTSNQALLSLLGKVSYFDRNHLTAHNNNKFTLEFSDALRTDTTNYLVFSNRVADTQEQQGVDIILHSSFASDDRLREQNKLFNSLSRTNRNDNVRVSGSHLCTASLNYSVKHMDIETTVPDSFCQLLGRRDRFGEYTDSVVRVREDISMVEGKRFMFCNVKLLKNFYAHLKTFENKQLTHREFMVNCYDKFYSDKKNLTLYKEYLVKQLNDGVEEMKTYFPQKRGGDSKSTSAGMATMLNFRGDSYTALAYCPVEDAYVIVSISEKQTIQEEVIKKKGVKYLKELQIICESVGIQNSYQHAYVRLGTGQNPYVLDKNEFTYCRVKGLIRLN